MEDEYPLRVHCHNPVGEVLNLENNRPCAVDVVSSNLMDAENHLAVDAAVVVAEAAELEVTVVVEVQYFFLEYGLAFQGYSAAVEVAKLAGILDVADIEDDQHEALQEDLLHDYALVYTVPDCLEVLVGFHNLGKDLFEDNFLANTEIVEDKVPFCSHQAAAYEVKVGQDILAFAANHCFVDQDLSFVPQLKHPDLKPD